MNGVRMAGATRNLVGISQFWTAGAVFTACGLSASWTGLCTVITCARLTTGCIKTRWLRELQTTCQFGLSSLLREMVVYNKLAGIAEGELLKDRQNHAKMIHSNCFQADAVQPTPISIRRTVLLPSHCALFDFALKPIHI